MFTKILAWAVTALRFIIVVLIAGLVFERIQTLDIGSGEQSLSVRTSVFWLSLLSPLYWLQHLATLCYLTALWAISDTLKALQTGTAFSEALIKGVKTIAANLAYGATSAMFITPLITGWIKYGNVVDFNFSIEHLTLGLIGLVLWLVTVQGQKISREMESFV